MIWIIEMDILIMQNAFVDDSYDIYYTLKGVM